MEISRRIFLQRGLVAAATCAAAPLKALSQGRLAESDGKTAPNHTDTTVDGKNADPYAALARLDRDSFVSAIGSAFHAQAGDNSFWLRLLSVNDLSGARWSGPDTAVPRESCPGR